MEKESKDFLPMDMQNILKDIFLYMVNTFEKQEENLLLALEYYKIASALGSSDATIEVAQLLEWGDEDVDRNMPEALKYYKKASDMGSLKATIRVAQLLERGDEGVHRNIPEALEYYEKASNMGSLDATIRAAQLLEWSDEGVHRNIPEALEYYKIASNMGSLDATIKVVQIYETCSDDVNKNTEECNVFYKKFVNEVIKDYEGKKDYISMVEDDPDEIGMKVQKLQKENKNLLYLVARFYEDGKGVEKDIKKALEYYEIVSIFGNFDAMRRAAQICKDGGEGVVEPDIKKALYYYKTLSWFGDIKATQEIVDIYKNGAKGVDEDAHLVEVFENRLLALEARRNVNDEELYTPPIKNAPKNPLDNGTPYVDEEDTPKNLSSYVYTSWEKFLRDKFMSDLGFSRMCLQ